MSEPTPAPPTIEFRTIADLHQVPMAKLQAFATDLVLWLHLHRISESEGFKVTTPRDMFGWIDDGRHDVKLSLSLATDVTIGGLFDGRERQPTWCRCGKCHHVWIAAYVPIDAGLFARICKRAICPACAETRKLFLYEPGVTPEPKASPPANLT